MISPVYQYLVNNNNTNINAEAASHGVDPAENAPRFLLCAGPGESGSCRFEGLLHATGRVGPLVAGRISRFPRANRTRCLLATDAAMRNGALHAMMQVTLLCLRDAATRATYNIPRPSVIRIEESSSNPPCKQGTQSYSALSD